MNKWITHGRIIPIGLSLLLSGCILFGWELLEKSRVQQEYANDSGSDVTLVFTYFKAYSKDTVLHDTLTLISKGFDVHVRGGRGEFASEGEVDRETICREMFHIDGYDSSRTVRLLVGNNVIKEWTGPRSYDDSIHSPFNCDSWVFEALERDARDIVGKMTFTITDEDLK